MRGPIQILGYRWRYIGAGTRLARGLGERRLYGWRYAWMRETNDWSKAQNARREKRLRLSGQSIRKKGKP